jgi:hypothetical protein
MFPKPPRPEPPRKAVAMQVVQQRVSGAVDTTVIVVPTPNPAQPAVEAAPAAAPAQCRGSQPI